MQAMEEIAVKLPKGVGFDWTGLFLPGTDGELSGAAALCLSMIVIFLCLAALYESWTIPISILLILPLGVIGGVMASSFRGLPNDVYFQIGLLTTLGLTTKNAILIVQYAMNKIQEGAGLMEATLEGAKLRFRPIVMTSLAFGFGVLPLSSPPAPAQAPRMPSAPASWAAWSPAPSWRFLYPLFYFLIYRLMGRSA